MLERASRALSASTDKWPLGFGHCRYSTPLQLVHSMPATDLPCLCSMLATSLDAGALHACHKLRACARCALTQPAHRIDVGLVILLHSCHVLGQVNAGAVYNGGVRGALHLGVACRGRTQRGVILSDV